MPLEAETVPGYRQDMSFGNTPICIIASVLHRRRGSSTQYPRDFEYSDVLIRPRVYRSGAALCGFERQTDACNKSWNNDNDDMTAPPARQRPASPMRGPTHVVRALAASDRPWLAFRNSTQEFPPVDIISSSSNKLHSSDIILPRKCRGSLMALIGQYIHPAVCGEEK
ncbi:hypothetical protein K504DRAFT_501577 [Pleomassaria siparia CBS 279.74]|uniref:Uncharacterized protein n=1 Tax=Pleomassaria siparia CBS 279.74 TaxID=1314801 RepID=A0A6G1KCW1_9PLEO|nr:hypothetical protein K504DRAFT_501577 [Pleomassaria siparia CBS 279.74]